MDGQPGENFVAGVGSEFVVVGGESTNCGALVFHQGCSLHIAIDGFQVRGLFMFT